MLVRLTLLAMVDEHDPATGARQDAGGYEPRRLHANDRDIVVL